LEEVAARIPRSIGSGAHCNQYGLRVRLGGILGSRLRGPLPRMERTLDDPIDDLVRNYRHHQEWQLEDAKDSGRFTNPSPGNPVDAADFLRHLDLDVPGIRAVLQECYPRARERPDLFAQGFARLRFYVWATLKLKGNLHGAYQAIRCDAKAQAQLGFSSLPCYETLRLFGYELLTPDRVARLQAFILRDMRRMAPNLGHEQVQDCTPHEATRRDEQAPFNGHYKVRMRRLELRWDPILEALLTHQMYAGNAHESRWLNIFTERLYKEGLSPKILTIDNGYAGFENHAFHGSQTITLVHRAQDSWVVDFPAAQAEVNRRFAALWQQPGWHRGMDLQHRLRFLIKHGSPSDREAAGRCYRDQALATRTPPEEAQRRQRRAENEGLNAELKRLPLRPQRQGALWSLRRVLACTLTLFVVQWTRLLHGIRGGLCRTAYIV
jgi:hypothetical protein